MQVPTQPIIQGLVLLIDLLMLNKIVRAIVRGILIVHLISVRVEIRSQTRSHCPSNVWLGLRLHDPGGIVDASVLNDDLSIVHRVHVIVHSAALIRHWLQTQRILLLITTRVYQVLLVIALLRP